MEVRQAEIGEPAAPEQGNIPHFDIDSKIVADVVLVHDFEPLALIGGEVDRRLLADGFGMTVGNDGFGVRIERLDERQEVIVRVAHFEREAPVGEILVTVKKAVDAFAGGEADFALKEFDGVGGQCVVVIEIGSNQQLRRGGVASPSRPASRPEIVVRRLSVRRPACPAL